MPGRGGGGGTRVDRADDGRVGEAGRRVDGVADDRVLQRRLDTGHHRPGVQPDPQAERRAATALVVEHPAHRPLHRQGRPDRALRVVLVRLRDAEGGHDGVAGELLHDPTVRRDAVRDVLEERVDATPHDDDAQYDAGLRPRTFDEYIGQDRVRENLQVSITAARQRAEALDHVLLFGPPGLGKTTLAYVIGNELGVPVRATSGPVMEKPGDLAAMLTSLQPREVLFIDEIHRMSPVIEEILYPAYSAAPRISSLSPMDDQLLGGLIMWVPGGVIFMLIMTVIFGTCATATAATIFAPSRATPSCS